MGFCCWCHSMHGHCGSSHRVSGYDPGLAGHERRRLEAIERIVPQQKSFGGKWIFAPGRLDALIFL